MTRKPYIFVGAGIAAAAATAAAIILTVGASWSPAPVPAPINLWPRDVHEVFAPPPVNTVPAMTWKQVMTARHLHPLPSDTTVQLGLFSDAIQADCGPTCVSEDGRTAYVRDGYIYDDAMPYQELAYGVSTPVCPAGSARPAWQCTAWVFFDANTGRNIIGWDPWPPRHGHL